MSYHLLTEVLTILGLTQQTHLGHLLGARHSAKSMVESQFPSSPWAPLATLGKHSEYQGTLDSVQPCALVCKEVESQNRGWLSRLSAWLLTLAQVVISRFVSSSPELGSALTVQSLFGILSPSLSAPPLLALSLKINKSKLKKKKKRILRGPSSSVMFGARCEGQLGQGERWCGSQLPMKETAGLRYSLLHFVLWKTFLLCTSIDCIEKK